MGLQAKKLLRALRGRRQVRPSRRAKKIPLHVDVRIVHRRDQSRPLKADARRRARFPLEDLYYRLNGFSITIPPLRERRDEIAPLARQFVASAATRMGLPTAPVLSEQAVQLLEAYRWPGNIRELRNMMERAVLLSRAGAIELEHLPVDNLRSATSGSLENALVRAVDAAEVPEGLSKQEQEDRAHIIKALAEALGNQTRAAEALGISRRWLSTKMARYKIPRPRKR